MYEVRHHDPSAPNDPPFDVERFSTETDAWDAYTESANTIMNVGGCCVLVNPAGEQMAKISKRRGNSSTL